jgi:alpha-glucoside transport system substrate-binding protein
MTSRRLKLLAPLLAFAVVAAACGDNDDTAEPSGEPAEDTTEEPADAPSEEPAEEPTEEPAGEPTEEPSEEPSEEPAEETPSEPENTVPESGELPEVSDEAIIVTGPERTEQEAGSLQQVLGAWGEENGVEVIYLGDANWEANINTQLAGGNPPDVSIFPQPGKLADFAREGHVVPLADGAAAATSENWSEAWTVFGNVDGTQYGVPVKSDLKSLVWYQPDRFAEAGYEVPETFDEFTALIEQMVADGGPKPLCVGIESAQATGWTYTDWVEDMVLRQHGPEVYDQWVAHEIPFNDPRIVESMQTVLDLWTEDNVFANSGTIAATAFQDNGQPLVDGNCYMHRQASFYSAFIPEGTNYVEGENAVDVFYFPDIDGTKPVLGAGTLAAAFNDRPQVHELLAYMATPEYAEARQTAQAELLGGGGALSGFLSAAIGQDPSVYQPLEQSFLDILSESQIVRFDASDLMPADVGAGTFWTEGTSAVNGDITAQEAADTIEASWPAG